MKATIGLEIHLALSTKQKLFSATENSFSVKEFSLFDCATPGVLPVISKEPVEMAVAFGLLVNAEIRKRSLFERKHYFYPDLPLGYQITQQHLPIIMGGEVDLGYKKVVIEHAHLECDAAKSLHIGDSTYIDISRVASALLEIVSTPCMNSAKEASDYAKFVHEAAMFLGICDGKLEEGSFRVDASISVSDTEKLGTRVEIKNISSFRFLEAAINYEIERQTKLIESGEKVVMETRLFKEQDLSTQSMRKKETVDEYRYLFDPDIPELIIDDEFIDKVKETYLTNYAKFKKEMDDLLKTFKIEEVDYYLHKEMWKLFYDNKELQTEKIAKIIHFWLPLGKVLSKKDLLSLIDFSAQQCKDILEKYDGVQDIKLLFPVSISLEEVSSIVFNIIKDFPEQLLKSKSGDDKMLNFLLGKCLKELKNKTTAPEIIKIIKGN